MILVILLLILSLTGGIVAAQELPAVPCGDLAASDCAILQQSQQAMATLTAFSFDIDAHLTLEDIPQVPGDLDFALTGSGAFAGDLSDLNAQATSGLSVLADPEQMAEFLQTALTRISSDLSLEIAMPEILVGMSDGQLPASIPIEARLVDGIGYLNFDPLHEAFGVAAKDLPEGWYGINVAQLITVAAQQQASLSGFGTSSLSPDMMGQFMDPEFLNRFMTISRVETVASAGNVAAFRIVLNYSALLEDPAVRDMISDAMLAQGDLSESDLDMALDMVSAVYSGLTLEMTQTISLDTYYLEQVNVDFSWDLSALMDAVAEMGGDTTMPSKGGGTPSVGFQAVITYADYNDVTPIEAPEDATVLPLEALGLPMPEADAASETPEGPRGGTK